MNYEIMRAGLTDQNAARRGCWDETVSLRMDAQGRLILHFEEYPTEPDLFEPEPALAINDNTADTDATDWDLVPRS